ncbi:MAG: stage II sporulation protein M [Candidatus Diapherotrites archaeon]
MVLESLLEEESLLKFPLYALFLGFVFSSVSMWIAFMSFPGSASILSIAFITMTIIPLVHRVFLVEEEASAKVCAHHRNFVERNFDLIKIYAWFAVGVIASYAIWYMLFPSEPSSICLDKGQCISIPTRNVVFKEQGTALGRIAMIAPGGGATSVARAAQQIGGACGNDFWCWFNLIYSNNASLLVLAVFLSVLFGAGALFLIIWNASIVGVLIGQNAVAANHLMFFSLLPHGIPEFAGYFLGAISGGLISVALVKKKYYPHEFQMIARDSFLLLVIALFSLLVGAAIEAFALIGEEMFAMALSVGYILFIAILVARQM